MVRDWARRQIGDGDMADPGESTLIHLLGMRLLFRPEAKAFHPMGMTFATSEDGQDFS